MDGRFVLFLTNLTKTNKNAKPPVHTGCDVGVALLKGEGTDLICR